MVARTLLKTRKLRERVLNLYVKKLTGATRLASCVNCAVDELKRCGQGRGARYRCPNNR